MIARIAGPAEFGAYTLILNISATVTLIILLGSHYFLLAKVTTSKYKKDYLNIFKVYFIVLSLLMFILIFLGASFFENLNTSIIYSGYIMVYFLFFVNQFIFMVKDKYKKLLYYNVLYYGVFLLFCLVFSANNHLEYLTFNMVSMIIALIVNHDLFVFSLNIDKRVLRLFKKHFIFSYKTFIIDFNNLIQQKIDFYIVYFFGGDYLAGIYAAIKNIVESILFIPRAIQPVILQTKNKTQYTNILSYFNIFLLIVISGAIILSNELISIIYGENYLMGNFTFKLLMISIYFCSMSIVIVSYKIRNSEINKTIVQSSIITSCFAIFSYPSHELAGMEGLAMLNLLLFTCLLTMLLHNHLRFKEILSVNKIIIQKKKKFG